MTEPEWKQLEILIAKIQQELAPEATVSHNVKLMGRQSETLRQIDVLVRSGPRLEVLHQAYAAADTTGPLIAGWVAAVSVLNPGLDRNALGYHRQHSRKLHCARG